MSNAKIVAGALPEGTVIKSASSEYLVEQVLGAGGFGITYKVTRRADNHRLALKEFFPDKLCERGEANTMSYLKTNAQTIETGMKDFITEAKRLDKQSISHPNIVSVDEVFKANNTAYFTMEYIDGYNLRQYIKKNHSKPLSVEQMLSVMRPVLQAVNLIHQHKLTHLDIKHENILLTFEEDGSLRPVLIDFGQAKHYDKKGHATSQLTNAGCSDGFAPPEQYLGLHEFTPQADVYALCATMLYLLTGQPPVKSSEMNAGVINSMLPETISPRIKTALTNGMRRNKEDRTQSVALLASELGVDISEGDREGNVTRLLNIADKPRRQGLNASKLVKPLIGVVAAAAVAGGVIWFINRPDAPSDQVQTSTPGEQLADNNEKSDATSEEDITNVAPAMESEEQQPEVTQRENTQNSDDEKFNQAYRNNDHAVLLALARQGYSKAYYPVAANYYNSRNMSEAERWAKKAVAANVSKSQANTLLAKINRQNEGKPSLKSNEGPAAAPQKNYGQMAEEALVNRRYADANRLAKQAISSGSGASQARAVVNKLEAIGYYDDPTNGPKP